MLEITNIACVKNLSEPDILLPNDPNGEIWNVQFFMFWTDQLHQISFSYKSNISFWVNEISLAY